MDAFKNLHELAEQASESFMLHLPVICGDYFDMSSEDNMVIHDTTVQAIRKQDGRWHSGYTKLFLCEQGNV